MNKAWSQGESSRFVNFKICEKRGRLLHLDEELDRKLRAMVITLRKAGSVINLHVIRGVLMGLIHSNPTQFCTLLRFRHHAILGAITLRMKFSRCAVTTPRPAVTKSLWMEVRSQFLHDISRELLEHGIPDELIINVDHTPSKFVPTENITMNAKGEKHVSRTCGSDILLPYIEKVKKEHNLPDDRKSF